MPGEVAYQKGMLRYEGGATINDLTNEKGPIETSPVERYVAFAGAGKSRKFFRNWDEPWKTRRLDNIQIHENTLFDGLDEAWTETAEPISANQSPGVEDVWISCPHRVHV